MNNATYPADRKAQWMGFIAAVALAFTVNGGLLFEFNQVATQDQSSTVRVITLAPVTVLASQAS